MLTADDVTKRAKAKEHAKKGRLETWALPPGSEQKFLTAISNDIEAGMSHNRVARFYL